MPGQNFIVGWPTEPEQAKRRLHQRVLRNDAIRGVGLLMRPTSCSRKGPHSTKLREISLPAERGVGEGTLIDHLFEGLVLRIGEPKAKCAAVGAQRPEAVAPDPFDGVEGGILKRVTEYHIG